MSSKTAFLWDESFLWGLMAYKALKANDLPFEIISTGDIKNGKLKNYAMLFVPGGWASNKVKALEDKGISQIKKFVNKGGNYLGFCGGAGLATLDGIGLLNIKRKPTKERVPSFSGRIHLNINDHPIWNSSLHVFHAWWPSQFLISDKNIKILATYGDPLSDSFSSDLNVGDVEANGNWQELENLYQINLDPKRLLNEPAVVEGTFGKGRVILSLIHFDTPEDENGARVLKNLWEYLTGSKEQKSGRAEDLKKKTSELLSDLETAVEELISLGIRNFLWFRRNPMLLQWRRGVRGLEYCTLYVMIKELKKLCIKEQDLHAVKELLIPFVDKAKQLLILERLAMQDEHITYEKCDDLQIKKIRTELFGNSKSHGGLFKNLIDEIDALLFGLIN
ncbi:MAG: BPL-N domain-containing protein [Nitrospirae bacterium]|nr:BPL-N domain-containing protein [Nitrospirota bacterium]MCL5978750.1 BPL-N domain-containing protein [Nitrospirota bacterium]